jgi:hypothetical protein
MVTIDKSGVNAAALANLMKKPLPSGKTNT